MVIVKNESLNIREWADHYFWQGAAHLVIIDNGCTDSTIGLLKAHPRSGDMTFFNLPRPYRQAEHYRYAFKHGKIKQNFRWLIVADGDEFWFSPSGRSLPEVLKSLEASELIYCNWTNFGSSGSETHPASLRKELTRCAPLLAPHELTKWAVRTDAIRRPSQIRVHKVAGCSSTSTVSENEQLQINHYVTQSQFFWSEVKMKRGDVFNPANDAARNMKMFDDLEAGFTATDDRLAARVRLLDLPTKSQQDGSLEANV